MSHPLIIGNWKLNGNKSMTINFITELNKKLKYNRKCKVVITPPSIYLDIAKQYLINSNIQLGAQNIDIHLHGPFTGEISAKMLRDIGALFVIIGHSERRIFHKENNQNIIKKINIAKQNELIPIICIGENKTEKENNQTKKICTNQLNIIIHTLGIEILKNTIIAYEPIWAIGSNSAANPNEVQQIHRHIRKHISSLDNDIAKNLQILYGGSINTKNITKFISQKDIDGVLVGNNSLNIQNFLKIIKISEQIKNNNIYPEKQNF